MQSLLNAQNRLVEARSALKLLESKRHLMPEPCFDYAQTECLNRIRNLESECISLRCDMLRNACKEVMNTIDWETP